MIYLQKEDVILKTKQFVFKELKGEASGHDWWHIVRVAKMAKTIALKEGADLFICEMAALLHDIADEKLNESEEAGLQKVEKWLEPFQLEAAVKVQIMTIIATISFKGGEELPVESLEAKVVQDADRLDAIGAIGIARTFAFAGANKQLIYDPQIELKTTITKEAYRKRNSTAIHHFYEKLLKLKDLMNTDYAKKIAAERHQRMESFLEDFFNEWEGK